MAIGPALRHAATSRTMELRSITVDGSEVADSSLLGIGLYTVPEAARLTGIPQARLRRWLRGYTRGAGEERTASPPIWRRQLPDIEGTLGLGFLDLMEARFVDAFRKAGVPWRVIRLGAERAREICGADHPFASQRFRSDGRTIFAEIMDSVGEPQLLDLVKSQLAFARVISPSLYAGDRVLRSRHAGALVAARPENSGRYRPGPQLRAADCQRGRHPHSRSCRCGRGRGFGRESRAAVPVVAPLDRGGFAVREAAGRSACGLRVFLDNNLSPYLAHALNVLLEPEGDQVIHLTDRFRPDTEDRAWIDALTAEGGWVVISADRRIHRNRPEREAWRRSRLMVFFLSPQWGRLRNIEIAWRLLRWWPRIEEQARLVTPPAAFELPRDYRSGRLRVLRG